ncbi:MAG TPA: CAP domain-containing protein [Anaeromyxobacteraceae bacterium]|jgi:uncharacterized protein YkwD|nr:CAP domain-containing protein [Anaeromyxobacteraceae bacterium]
MAAGLLAALLLAAASPAALEQRVFDLSLAPRPGPTPRLTPALSRAARSLARDVAAQGPAALSTSHLRAALAAAGAFDPSPEVRYERAEPEAAVARAGLALRALPATDVGVGAVLVGNAAHVVVLASVRRATLTPFPARVSPGAVVRLRGALAGLRDPRVHLTLPSGEVREGALGTGPAFEAALSFSEPGRYVLEVTGTGPRGPTVAVLLPVACGDVPLEEQAASPLPREPASPEAAERAVAAAVGALRERQRLAPLAWSAALAQVARRHSEAMAKAGQVAHVLPGGLGLEERLRGVRYRRALENVASGASALAAHGAAEESPAHRANLLERGVRELGVGVARRQLASGEVEVFVTEILAEPDLGM